MPEDNSLEEQIRNDFISELPKTEHRPGLPMNPFTADGQETTVSEKTIAQYERTGKMLFRRWLREQGKVVFANPNEANAADFIKWFTEGAGRKSRAGKPLSKASYRLYRAGVWWWINHEMQDAVDFSEACRMLADDAYGSARNYSFERSSTTSLRFKKFPDEDFQAIIEWLQHAARRGSTIAIPTIFFLKASLLTGLRPHEWEYAKLYETENVDGSIKIILAVPNSKHSNGRATGDARLIDITDFDPEDISVIKTNLDTCGKWRAVWKSKDREMSRIMNKANKSIWPRRRKVYMLYSCRHQAIANFKTIYDKPTIAAIVGHGSSNTAGEHYGRRRSGSSSLRSVPKPVEDELNMSIRRDHERFMKREAKLAAKAEAAANPANGQPSSAELKN